MSTPEGSAFRAKFEEAKSKLSAAISAVKSTSAINTGPDDVAVSFASNQQADFNGEYLRSVKNALSAMNTIFELDKKPGHNIWQQKPEKQGKGAIRIKDLRYGPSEADLAIAHALRILEPQQLNYRVTDKKLVGQLAKLRGVLDDLLNTHREMIESVVQNDSAPRSLRAFTNEEDPTAAHAPDRQGAKPWSHFKRVERDVPPRGDDTPEDDGPSLLSFPKRPPSGKGPHK